MEEGGPLIQCDWHPYKKRRVTEKHTGKKACEEGGRNWRDASTSQGTPRVASNHQKLGEARKDSYIELSESP